LFIFEIQEAGQFSKWIKKFRDKKVKVAITNRINMLMLGRFGDHKYFGEKISELRVHIGFGYRIYFSVQEKKVIILLCGGDKSSQKNDIKRAVKIFKGIVSK